MTHETWKLRILLKGEAWEVTCGDVEIGPLVNIGRFSIDQVSVNPERISIEIRNWLASIEQSNILTMEQRFAFEWLFSDSRLMSNGGLDLFLDIKLEDSDSHEPGQAVVLALAAVFQGICLFLGEEPRCERMSAYLAHLYSAWQWFALLKYMTAVEKTQTPAGLLRDFSHAYRVLNKILSDEQYALAAGCMQTWTNPNARSGPLLREYLKTSLVLWQGKQNIRFNSPYGLLEKHASSTSLIDWQAVKLHPVFSKHPSARKAVRAIISQYTFPRYNFDTTIHLSRLLKKNQLAHFPLSAWLGCVLAAVWLALILGAGGAYIFSRGGLNANSTDVLWTACGEFLLGPAAMFVFLVSIFETTSLAYLTAPRMVGGVLIGYLNILLQGDSIKLNNFLWSYGGGLPIAILWAGVLLAGFAYLYFDIFPQVRDSRTTLERTLEILAFFILISIAAGFILLALVTGMQPVDVNACTAAACQLTLLGPFGWVNVSYFLAFVPMALITGLVTQFVFEDRTVTSPVWAPEEE